MRKEHIDPGNKLLSNLNLLNENDDSVGGKNNFKADVRTSFTDKPNGTNEQENTEEKIRKNSQRVIFDGVCLLFSLFFF
jgi:hypothetical protein